ncbi:MAG: transcriptional regulator [Proteobacteria bacterium]|nr:transcriptional regulator [Cystobacterineae bacterium]MCL2258745.1 transcriptional regulator [Cystobacterineae bacterium]MCL2314303.1 transcriptional regulator [Pseudomonadota bacterium]
MSEDIPLPFSIGEAVVYPNQGLCNISGIEEKEVANQKLLFIHLVRQIDGAKVMVPISKAFSVGLRKVATPNEVLDMLEFLKSNSDKASLDWKTRARTNTEHMARGSLLGLAEVVKALQVLSELRPLPNKERELYNNARGMLVEEMAISLGVEPCDAEDSVDLVLFPVGKARPRRTPEEFQLGLESPLEADLLSLEETEFLKTPEEESPTEIEEEMPTATPQNTPPPKLKKQTKPKQTKSTPPKPSRKTNKSTPGSPSKKKVPL